MVKIILIIQISFRKSKLKFFRWIVTSKLCFNPNRSLAFWWWQLLFLSRCFDALKTQWGFIVTENGETDEKKKVCQRINSLMTVSGLSPPKPTCPTSVDRCGARRRGDVGHVGFEGLFSLISLCPEFELFLQNGLKESPISVFISRWTKIVYIMRQHIRKSIALGDGY